jgi:predicted YcjX-like family ATPase
MPLDKFGYYSLVEPLQKDTTKWVKSESTSTLRKLMAKYKDNLNYYSHLKSSEQTSLAVDIITDLERYRSLLVMKENGDLNFYAKNKTVFNTYIEMFERFGREKNK